MASATSNDYARKNCAIGDINKPQWRIEFVFANPNLFEK